MIVAFSIANTFSIYKDKQTISFEAVDTVATDDAHRSDIHLVCFAGTSPRRRLLKGACLYGANASGKTNILTVLRFYVHFAADSFAALKPHEETHFMSFRFDD